jgi:HAE1 family hydrophobic/amphiphilic exporter-1
MNLDRFINRPVLSTVISIVIVILGFIGLSQLPITQYPNIAPPTIMVYTNYPGANAQTVLNAVVAPLENQINGVENMMYMSSSASNSGTAQITITFKQGTDPDMAAIHVQNRVSMAQGLMPAEVTRVGIMTMKRQTSMLLIFSLYDESDTHTTEFIENYASINILPEIQRIKGVGDTQVMGVEYAMRIWLKPEIMAQYGLMPTDISNALAEQNVEAAPGQFGQQSNQTYQYTIRYKGRLQTPEEFEDIVLKSLDDGSLLRIKDVATVDLGRTTYSFFNRVNGHKAVTAIAMQLPGSNATEAVQGIEKALAQYEGRLPAGLKINIAQSVNEFLFASIYEVIKTLIEAFILVFIVVYIFLQDFRSTLIPAIAIPVALIGTFFLLYVIGFSLNLLTLSALVLAIAIVVDDAIVVVEGVHAKLDQGYTSAKQASIDAMRELASAILSITLVMMSVFIPVSFMSGTAGAFYQQFGMTMAIAIGFSAINALTLSPALCAIFLKPHKKHEEGEEEKEPSRVEKFHRGFNRWYDNILEKYKKRVAYFIEHKKLSLGIVAASIIALILLMQTTPSGMVPNEDTGTLMGTVTLPAGTSQERSIEIMLRVDSLIAAEPAVQSRTMISGFSFTGGSGPSYGSFIIKLKDFEERGLMQNSQLVFITLYMRAQKIIPEAQVLFFQPPMIQGYSMSSDIQLYMQDKTGGTLDNFFQVVNEYDAALEARPEINSARTSFSPDFPQYEMDIDAAACKRAGVSPATILTAMQGYYGGLYASNFNRFGRMYRVMVQADPEATKDLETLKNIKVKNNAGEMAPISQFFTMKKVYGPDVINRFNMYTSMTVMVSPAAGYTSGEALNAIAEVAETLPPGFGYELGGLAREEAETSGSTTAIIFLLCFVFVYLLLSAQYESYILPLAVLLSVPFGLMGSFIFVNIMSAIGSFSILQMIMGSMSNDIYMQIALIMLMGLLAKNAILIVEFALDRRKQGMSLSKAAVLGAAARLRPILMTSLAMIVGLLPLMFAFGVGAHGNRTLGAAAVGGMLIGMILQIFFVPMLFVVFQHLQEKVKPIEWSDIDNSDATPEIAQYTK